MFQELVALNSYLDGRYRMHYWREPGGHEVDFILYGQRGFWAIEVKRAARLGDHDFAGLRAFLGLYPRARALMVYGGNERYHDAGIEIVPVLEFFKKARTLFFTNRTNDRL